MLQSDSSESFHTSHSTYCTESRSKLRRGNVLLFYTVKIRSITNIEYHWKLRDRGSFALAYTRDRAYKSLVHETLPAISPYQEWMYVPRASVEPNLLRYNWLPLYYIHASKRWEPIFMHSRSGEVGKLFLFQLIYVLHTSNIMLRSRKRFDFRLAALQRQ